MLNRKMISAYPAKVLFLIIIFLFSAFSYFITAGDGHEEHEKKVILIDSD